ncbi:unnamed protein product [Vitrella brassicaformis CCMP3155]|uniref:Uncharacterized protein n=1 Tax=Vitrella brassicaformis (strain CCMP3155) TaxID=1169540 RepID=A0A0G4G8V3_VITBC|nr:unnamed protein product [Vitrella brassicaformis CCMP3155]|eukprot:CEM25238.1 unnamed protein product [Vitrella brassicaformis CCMP3155]
MDFRSILRRRVWVLMRRPRAAQSGWGWSPVRTRAIRSSPPQARRSRHSNTHSHSRLHTHITTPSCDDVI